MAEGKASTMAMASTEEKREKGGTLESLEIQRAANGFILRERFRAPAPKKGQPEIGWKPPEEYAFQSSKAMFAHLEAELSKHWGAKD